MPAIRCRLDVLVVCLSMALSPVLAMQSPWLAGATVTLSFLIATQRWLRYRLAHTRRRDDPRFQARWPLLSSAVIVAPLLATFGALQLLFGTLHAGPPGMLLTGLVVGTLSAVAFSGAVAQVFGRGQARRRLLEPARRQRSWRA